MNGGWVSLRPGPGGRMRTMELVEKLRQFRGRLSRRLLCRALGFGDDNRTAYNVVSRICREYEIATLDDHVRQVEALQARPVGKQSPEREAARRQLEFEIAEHRRTRATALPLKTGKLEW